MVVVLAMRAWSPMLAALAPALAAQSVRVSRSMEGLRPGGTDVSVVHVRAGVSFYETGLFGGWRVEGETPTPVGWSNARLALPASGPRTAWYDLHATAFGSFLSLGSERLDGTDPLLLLESFGIGFSDFRHQLTPDGVRILLHWNGTLHSLRLDGGGGLLELADLTDPADFDTLRVSPNSLRALYEEAEQLFTKRVDGAGLPARLDQPGHGAVDMLAYDWAPDSARVVFLADQEVDDVRELFLRPLALGSPLKLNGTLVQGGDVRSFRISPDGAWVAFTADAAVDERIELYLVPLGGGAAAQAVSGVLGPDADVLEDFEFSDDSAYLVYRVDNVVDERPDLLAVRTDGASAPLVLSAPPVAGGAVLDFELPPGGTRLVYRADGELDERIELYSAPLDGSAPAVRLSAPAHDAADVQEDYQLGAGGQFVAFRHDRDAAGEFQLLVRDLAGNGPTYVLNGPLDPGSAVQPGFDLGLGGGRVVYRSDEELRTQVEAYIGSIAGEHRRISDDSSTAGSGDVTRFLAGANGRVVYASDRLLDQHFALASAALDGRPEHRTLTDPTVGPHNDFPLLALTPDGRHLAYAQHLLSGDGQLFVTRTDGTSPPLLVAAHEPTQLETTADGSRYVYQRNSSVYSGPIDGSSPPVLISAALASTRFALAPDGTSAVFLAYPQASGFYRALLDGSAAPLLISGALPAFAYSFEWELTPDGTSLLYRADALQDEQDELFVAPYDGATPPVRLNAPLVAGTDVLSLCPTPDSSRVLFVTGTLGGSGRKLFSVPIDGSQAPLDLSGSWSSGRGLILTISPDSSRAVFLTDARTSGQYELFSVPLDGSAPPVVLNGPLPFRGDVLNVGNEDAAYIDRASTGVVFLANTTSSQLDFYRAPLDGSSPAQLVGGSIPNSSGFVASLQSPDREWIAFERRVDSTTTLYCFPAGGNRPPRRLDGPTVPLGSVLPGSFAFTPDSRRVLYLADQDTDASYELYQSPLEPLWRR